MASSSASSATPRKHDRRPQQINHWPQGGATSAHLWADRFDGSLEDIFELQDKVASSVAGLIEPALQAAEVARSARRPTSDLTAYDLYLRGYAMALASAARFPEALALIEQAIERDPRFGQPSPMLPFAVCRSAWMVAALIERPIGGRGWTSHAVPCK